MFEKSSHYQNTIYLVAHFGSAMDKDPREVTDEQDSELERLTDEEDEENVEEPDECEFP